MEYTYLYTCIEERLFGKSFPDHASFFGQLPLQTSSRLLFGEAALILFQIKSSCSDIFLTCLHRLAVNHTLVLTTRLED